MERLTTKFPNGYFFNLPSISDERAQAEYVDKMANKLGTYEDAEEQGLLIRLPCKAGSTVYVIKRLQDGKGTRVIEEITVSSFDIRPLQKFVLDSEGHRLNFSKFGEIAFLSKEEAEQALKQMGE